MDDRTALFKLYDRLKTPRGGPVVWGWHGYAPRSLFTAALQARHASIHRGPHDVLVDRFARCIALDRRRERIAQGLLEEGWDEQVHTDDQLRARLRAAVHDATCADTELWEHTVRRQRVVPLDDADRIRGAHVVHDDTGLAEKADVVLSKLPPDQRNVAHCYAQTGLTWKQAALKAGHEEKMGERVRRKLRREGREYRNRRQ
ncbi:hypothetical protein ACWGN5_35300 [Streptomyces sp. NPDC055815]